MLAADAKKYEPLEKVVAKRNLPTVEEVYKQKQGIIGGQKFTTAADLDEARKTFKVPDGYDITCFASEKDFPLNDPLAMAFDARGRMWVTTMPSYPHYLPGVPPNDKILILEDTDGDGKADKCTTFADGLYLPTGFEFGDGGVYVAAQPNMLFLKDSKGGDHADTRDVILHGFGTGDSHHAMHALRLESRGGTALPGRHLPPLQRRDAVGRRPPARRGHLSLPAEEPQAGGLRLVQLRQPVGPRLRQVGLQLHRRCVRRLQLQRPADHRPCAVPESAPGHEGLHLGSAAYVWL